ncbi:Glycosyl transferase family 14 [Arabidopsis suecica]|uniref:Glycosyl transferase family 14 n=1 Tax=Arabidopsis suecica TaxID=45249 RepID=A0A8T1ZB06_ARASU|nr:Glycosyl transferase family 14 [Arabidopsis suecica]
MFSNQFVLFFSFLLCLPFVFFFVAPHVFPSPPGESLIPISDEIDDRSLFIAAAGSTSLSHLSSGNPNPKLKIAFLFLTNSDLHFAPIWDRFFSGHSKSLYNVYVHADPFVNVTRPGNGSVFENAFIANAKRTARASPTLISATRRLLATAFLDDPANTYFAVLSQYCIPLHSFNYVYSSLFESATFDKSDPDPTPNPRGIRILYRSFMELISDEPRLWKRYTARGRYAMMPEVPFEKFRVGSQFFVMTRRHALLTIKDRILWRKFKLPCYRSDECYPEEHYFPTLLNMKDPDGCTGYTLTRVNWTGTVKGHPYTYKPKEVVPELIQRLRQSNHSSSYFFARKFTPACLKPLLAIADSVIFRD